jgi:hypothetical protein
MSVTRRKFLAGAGSLITAAFMGKATSYAFNTGKPLLLEPPIVKRTIYADSGSTWKMGIWEREPKYKLSFWADDEFNEMNLRQFLNFFEVPITNAKDIEEACERKTKLWLDFYLSDEEYFLEQLEYPITYYVKYDDNYGNTGPSAQVNTFLTGLPLGDIAVDGLEPPEGGSHIWLEEADGWIQQFDYYYESYAMDDLALSLLQARLIELGEPVQIKVIK